MTYKKRPNTYEKYVFLICIWSPFMVSGSQLLKPLELPVITGIKVALVVLMRQLSKAFRSGLQVRCLEVQTSY